MSSHCIFLHEKCRNEVQSMMVLLKHKSESCETLNLPYHLLSTQIFSEY